MRSIGATLVGIPPPLRKGAEWEGAGGCCQRDVVALQSFNFFSFDSFSFRSTQLGNGGIGE